MKKILFFIFLACKLFFSDVSASDLNDKATKCVNTINKREIEDFLCVPGTKEFVAYQILLDERFKEIDEKIEQYISELESNKAYYFGKEKSKNFIDAVQNILNIYRSDGEFGNAYYTVCAGLHQEVISELKTSVQISNAAHFFADETTVCTKLADQKLLIYKQVSYDILLLNKLQISKDEKKAYVQTQRTQYDGLISKFQVHIGYVERIWAKWPLKIKNTSGGG